MSKARKHTLVQSMTNGETLSADFYTIDGKSAFELWVEQQPPKQDGTQYTEQDYIEFNKGSIIEKVEIISDITTETIDDLDSAIRKVLSEMGQQKSEALPFGLVSKTMIDNVDSDYDLYLDLDFFMKYDLGSHAFVPMGYNAINLYYLSENVRDPNNQEYKKISVGNGYSICINIIEREQFGEINDPELTFSLTCFGSIEIGYDLRFGEQYEYNSRLSFEYMYFGEEFKLCSITPCFVYMENYIYVSPAFNNLKEVDWVSKDEEFVFKIDERNAQQLRETLNYRSIPTIYNNPSKMKFKISYRPYEFIELVSGGVAYNGDLYDENLTTHVLYSAENVFLLEERGFYVLCENIQFKDVLTKIQYNATPDNFDLTISFVYRNGKKLTYSDIAILIKGMMDEYESKRLPILFPTLFLDGDILPKEVMGTVFEYN